jgi:hypothetical protein
MIKLHYFALTPFVNLYIFTCVLLDIRDHTVYVSTEAYHTTSSETCNATMTHRLAIVQQYTTVTKHRRDRAELLYVKR